MGTPETFSDAERAAMERALALAASPEVPHGPNPRVGCVLLDAAGRVVAEGRHLGAGSPHAEVAALRDAAARGVDTRGLTAVVTLEPCTHTGRTGPCTTALLEAGVGRVVYAQSDRSPVAGGGGALLARAGVDVAHGLLAGEARALNRVWTRAVDLGRPFVTWKLATSLDGRSAAADGTSRWVSNAAARRDTHRRRAVCDAIAVGTGTVLADDPQLTVRDVEDQPLPREQQPLRVVVGLRDVPQDRRVLDDAARTVHLRTRSPQAVLAALAEEGRHHVFLEGGPTLAGAFLTAGLVDEVVAYVAPALLGPGTHAVEGLAVGTIADAVRLEVQSVDTMGEGADRNVRLVMTPPAGTEPATARKDP